jgi:hypothetical protein
VWEVPAGTGGEALEEPADALLTRLDEAFAQSGPLTAAQRSARNGLTSRQLTIN